MDIRQSMATYVFLGWKDSEGKDLGLEEYCLLVNTSVRVFKDFYVRDTGIEAMEKTQDVINNYFMGPSQQVEVIAEINSYLDKYLEDSGIDFQETPKEAEEEDEIYSFSDSEGEEEELEEWMKKREWSNKKFNWKEDLKQVSASTQVQKSKKRPRVVMQDEEEDVEEETELDRWLDF